MADFKIGNITPSHGKLRVGESEVSKVYNGATLIWQNAFVFTTRAQLDTAISLWISDNAAALNTYGEINTWKFEANASLADFSDLFLDKTTFNSDISDWDVSNVTDMESMFENASSFNQSLNSWDVSNVTDMDSMFKGATNFNGNISSWNTGSVTRTGFMFYNASAFNQDIGSWDVSSVTFMAYMFRQATSFNQDIGSWDVSNVGTGTSIDEMQGVFLFASSFNQDLSSWDVSNVEDMLDMFKNATSFNQDLSSWNVSNVTDMSGMLYQTAVDTTNYDALLIGWNLLTLQPNVVFGADDVEYCSTAAQNARASLTNINTNNWTITDGGQAAGCP